jgi:hypothetical protein
VTCTNITSGITIGGISVLIALKGITNLLRWGILR